MQVWKSLCGSLTLLDFLALWFGFDTRSSDEDEFRFFDSAFRDFWLVARRMIDFR